MNKVLAVLGVGNMAGAVISGLDRSEMCIEKVVLFDKNPEQYSKIKCQNLILECASSVSDAVAFADYVLISVKPQNYKEVLVEISKVSEHEKKKYISIGAGVTSAAVSDALSGATVFRVLPNVPMLIGMGVSAVCRNENASAKDFDFVCKIFESAGSVLVIDETEMNRIIGVTSSSPAYVFKFIDAIYKGALAQGLSGERLVDTICDMVIGSATLLKNGDQTPEELIAKVASKGGTTEQALLSLDNAGFEKMIADAMKACTIRADELGKT